MYRLWRSVVVALLSYWVWGHKHALLAQLYPKNLPALFDNGANCEVIRDDVDGRFKFCEDGVVVAPGVAIFSCDPGRHKWNTVMGPTLEPDPRGDLWGVHYTSGSVIQKPYRIKLAGFPTDADFHPLGIEQMPTGSVDGVSRLLVINHRREEPAIEVFRIQLGQVVTLNHEMTLRHPSFISPNAIAAISPSMFYLSQDHYFTYRITWPFNAVLPLLETLLAIPLGRVSLVLFDTENGVRKVQTVVPRVPFANGVAVSPDGSTLAVAATNRAEVQFYSRNQTHIAFVTSVQVPFSVDNIAYAGDKLLAAGHPYLPEFMALAKGRSDKAPSYVSTITPKGEEGGKLAGGAWISRIIHGAEVTDVFKSDGTFFTSSSGAFADLETNTMFIVGLYGNGVAKCRLV